MLVKSYVASTHLPDFEETFVTIKKFQMQLNLARCAFEVSFKNFLGFMIHQLGIDGNPEKV